MTPTTPPTDPGAFQFGDRELALLKWNLERSKRRPKASPAEGFVTGWNACLEALATAPKGE